MTNEDEKPKPAADRKSDFLAAEDIKAVLSGRDPAEQERIIRWVGESLGLTLHVRPKPTQAHSEELASEPSGAASAPVAPAFDSGRSKDIRSFVQEKQPKNDIQFAAAVAYYHRFVAGERKESITTEDLQEGARHSSRAVFKSPSVTLNNAVQQGYLDRGPRAVSTN